eukprot:CAMPEP_0175440120 /NCGR_PEP_ID=MMETSP0095-20121207/56901_1 /TAXON_ID=311494 /ORGANISM="Alexandrium monilatum, Strain CCMP3105" /LENGTH=98 /DNA_ID=CAMNT_0016739973 /DNA_START=20 /DNA_END=312 /DNA_ORIENTATION=-
MPCRLRLLLAVLLAAFVASAAAGPPATGKVQPQTANCAAKPIEVEGASFVHRGSARQRVVVQLEEDEEEDKTGALGSPALTHQYGLDARLHACIKAPM